jgi:sugar/nucleoside kinase (ribokinase family)
MVAAFSDEFLQEYDINFDTCKNFIYMSFLKRGTSMKHIPVIATVGEILVEFVSHKKNCGLSNISDYSGPYPSGAPAIFLDQAARMGAETQLFGGVGNDGFGSCVLERLAAHGVGTSGVTIHPNHSTGVAFVSYYDNGNRDFIFHLANTAADNFTVSKDLIDPSNTILHISAASMGNTAMRDMILATMRMVYNAGGQISCDPNARPELMRDNAVRAALNETMDCSTYLMPSTSDLDFLFPDMSEDAAVDHLLKAKAEVIVIKRGAKGATIVGHGQRYDFAGHAVQELDPTGAGDCFGGTFISLLAQGSSLQDAGSQANAAGALAVTRRGPMEGNSSPAELKNFISTKRENVA